VIANLVVAGFSPRSFAGAITHTGSFPYNS
jgi:hypothetical protein